MATAATGWRCTHKVEVVSETETQKKIKVTCYWQNDGWYYDVNGVSAWVYCGGQSYQVKSGSWVDSSQGEDSHLAVSCGSYTFTINKTHSAQSLSCYAKITANSTYVSGTKSSTATTASVAAKTKYTVSYNANGGSGAPASQTKWHGEALVLQSGKPTRTGYTFKGWALSAAGSVYYSAGEPCGQNKNLTLYAVWQALTYTVTYNANGGTGAPGSQIKTYGTTLKLSTVKPTKADYNFKGWATSATATTATYAAGGDYTANSAVTLYAVWELAYTKPTIYNFTASRCGLSRAMDESGSYALVEFSWKTTKAVSEVAIEWTSASGGSGSVEVEASGVSGEVSQIIGGSLDPDVSYTITARVADSGGEQESKLTLNGSKYAVDFKAGGDGVSFGKPAELGAEDSLGGNGVADFAFDAKFNQPVYGNVLGLSRLPAIPEGAELNDYITTGAWAIRSNAVAATVTCGGVKLGTDDSVPPARAGRFEVNSATGEGIRLEQWSYLRQRFIPYNMSNPTYEREVFRGENNVWTYYDWWRSSLSPAASQKVYDKAAITIALSADATPSAANTYGRIPLNVKAQGISERLTLTDNGVRIGAGIDYVKVSGQTSIQTGNTDGNRHARIQKVKNGTYTSFAWVCVNMSASKETQMAFTPVIIPVDEGDVICMSFYTSNTADKQIAGSSANGYRTYLTVEEL